MAVQVKASFKLTGWNATQLKLRVPAIMTAYDKVIYPQFKEEIKRSQFTWPRETRRYGRLLRATNLRTRAKIRAEQAGQAYRVVGSPRDIVDSGAFLGSQERVGPGTTGTSLVYRWNAPYAALILTGYTTVKGTVVPGRDWIKPALEAKPLDAFFAAEWRKLAGRQL